MQWHHNELVSALAGLSPTHPVHRRLVVQGDWCPELSRILGPYQIMHRPGYRRIGGFRWVPLGAHGHFHQTVTVDVSCSDAHVVMFGEIFHHNEPLPVPIAVPDELFLVSQQDVWLPIAIHIPYG